jgi:hypothetical protein
MRARIATLALLLAAAALIIPTARADSPNFHDATASVSTTTGALSVDFKETGLGTTVTTEQVTLHVDVATAEYQCFNNGGNHPKAGNKETVVASLTTVGTFGVRNGQTTGTISAGPPSQGDFACPSGQSLYLQSASYAGITVTGSAGDSLGATPDPVGTGPVHLLVG